MEKEVITTGIVAEDYKLEKFKEELAKKDFTDIEVVPFMKGISTIKVKLHPDRIDEMNMVCELVQLHFKRSN